MLLEGRVAAVSGVGPGMGRDITLTLAGEGADMVLAARHPERLAEVAAEVNALGRRAWCVPTDITDLEQCRRFSAAVAEGPGRLDILVNNAFAEEDWHHFDGFDPARWVQPFEVNVHGTLQLTQALLPIFRQGGGGSIVMISTLSIRVMNPPFAGYAASKQSLETAARVLAHELGPAQIRVNSVAPGHIWGDSLKAYFAWQADRRGISPDDVYDEVASLNPLHAIPTSEEISRAVLFFASDLSRAITGQTLDVNCGRTSH